jgi:hypothetical protein
VVTIPASVVEAALIFKVVFVEALAENLQASVPLILTVNCPDPTSVQGTLT